MTLEDRRLKLHERLKYYLGSSEVYYDPPESIAMKYPAIVYSKARIDANFADNKRYRNSAGYSVTLIRKDDDDILDKLLDNIEYTRFDRSYNAYGLCHDVFTVFI